MNNIKLNYNNDTNSKLAKFLALARRKRIIALTQRNVKLQHGAASNQTKTIKRKMDTNGNEQEDEVKIKMKKYIETLERKIENLEKSQSLGDTRVVQIRETTSSSSVDSEISGNLKDGRNDLRIVPTNEITKPKSSNSQTNSYEDRNSINILEDLMLSQAIDRTISRISYFSGNKDEDFSIWFDDLKDALKKYSINEEEKILLLKSKLKGDARYTFEGFQPHVTQTLEKIGQAMETVFGIAHDTREWLNKLNETKQKQSESIHVFAHRISRMVLKAYPETKNVMETNNKLSIDYFLRGLNDDIGEQVSILKPKTLEIAIEQAMRIESKHQIKKKTKAKHDNFSKPKLELNALSEATHEPYKNDINNRFKQLHEKISNNTKREQQLEEKLNVLIEGQKRAEHCNYNSGTMKNNLYQNRTTDRYQMNCSHCNKKGHSYQTCYYATDNDKKRLQNKSNLNAQGPFSNSQRTMKP